MISLRSFFIIIGDYGSCVLDLEQNSLTRFEEASFKSILQDVDNVIGPNGGYGLYIGTSIYHI